MQQRPIRATLDDVAARHLPADPDLWPAIRLRVGGQVPRRAPRARHQRPALALLAASALLAVLLTASSLWLDRRQTASARAILDLAQAAAGSQAPRYHLTATLHASGTDATVERWSAGGGRLRDETQYRDGDGRVTTTIGRISDGTQAWHYSRAGDRTQYTTGPLPAAGRVNPLRGGPPADGTDLAAFLDMVGVQGCGTARLQGAATVAQRAVHVIVVTDNGTCQRGGAGGRLIVRVDQRTFLVLGWERFGSDGAVLGRYTVDSIAYDVTLPDTLFTFTPPPSTPPPAPAGTAQPAQ